MPTYTSTKKPIVLMSMGAQERSDLDYQVMTNKYMDPLVHFSKCQPILIPTCFNYESDEIAALLDMCDGLYLSGASTNMDPALYGQTNLTPEKKQDKGRDLFNLAVVRMALDRGLPVLGVCRGLQELNVAYGGTLHQKAYAVPGFNDHREDPNAENDVMYGLVHAVETEPGTWFRKTMGVDSFRVNSLHGQAIDRLGEGMKVLARSSEDGLIEAIYASQYPQFSLAVQWHPEWKTNENPNSIKIFEAFGQACYGFLENKKK